MSTDWARIAAQRQALNNVGKAHVQGIDDASIEWVVSDQRALIDDCMAAAVDAGPDCKEFDQMGGVMDSLVLLNSAVSLSNEQSGDSRLASQFLRQARRALEVDSQNPTCLAD